MIPEQRGSTEMDPSSVLATDPAHARQRRLLLRIDEAAAELGISRSTFYELIARGEIATVRIGTARRVPFAELERHVAERTERGR